MTPGWGTASVISAHAGHAGPSSFVMLYELSGDVDAEMRVFDDPESVETTGDPLRVEWFPLETGGVRISGYAERMMRRDLEERMRGRNLVMVRVGNAIPGKTYHVALYTGDPDESGVESARIPVTMARHNAFVHEARQFLVEIGAGGIDLEGTVLMLSHPNTAWPLFAVVGDHAGTGRAWFDLSHFLAADGETNAVFSGDEDFLLSIVGWYGEPVEVSVRFTGETTVAAATSVVYAVTPPEVASFTLDVPATVLSDVPFSITVRAVDAQGNLVTTFTDAVMLSASTDRFVGGGLTSPFSAGVLEDHDVAIGEVGAQTVSVHWDEGDISVTSDPIEVLKARHLLLTVDPPGAGAAAGGGWFAENAVAPISVEVPDRWRLVHWVGSGVAEPYNLATEVLLSTDRVITAVLAPVDPEETYAMWRRRHFLRHMDDPSISGPDADPNNNGIINLLEYAYGNDPLSDAEPRRSPVLWYADGVPMLTFYRRVNNPHIHYILESTPQIGEVWQPYHPLSEHLAIEPIDVGMEEVVVTLPVPDDDPVYYRVRVVLDE